MTERVLVDWGMNGRINFCYDRNLINYQPTSITSVDVKTCQPFYYPLLKKFNKERKRKNLRVSS